MNIITNIISWIISLLDILTKGKNRNDKKVYQIDKSNLKRSFNRRFGFTFIEPTTWDRADPLNEDGSKFRHPTKTDISFSIYGSYDVFDAGDIWNIVENHRSEIKKKRGYKLLMDRQSGNYSFDDPYDKVIGKEPIIAWKTKYSYKDKKSRKRLTVLEYKGYYDNVCFTLHFQAPTKDFDFYEDFFYYIKTQFKVVADKSASLRGIY